jgi:hypothetical protein
MAGDADERFGDVVEALGGEPGVSLGTGRRGFGSESLTVGGKIFAMAVQERLVLKLPRDTVTALIDRGDGHPFDAGKGRPMKEWVALDEHCDAETVLALARDAYRFVGGPPAGA